MKPPGPFDNKRPKKILQGNDEIGTGAGHNSVFQVNVEYYIVYHRRKADGLLATHRLTCVDRMHFTEDGEIEEVQMTEEGVEARQLPLLDFFDRLDQ